jgi:MtN3 and saliva related transmembrane protein
MAGWTVEVVGACAATVTTLCWVPQAMRILRTRDTSAISLASQGAFTLGIALWLAYGVLIGSWPVTLANLVTLILVSTILVLKLRYG